MISTLVKIPVLQMDALAEHYVAKTGKRLIDVLDSETSSYFGFVCSIFIFMSMAF